MRAFFLNLFYIRSDLSFIAVFSLLVVCLSASLDRLSMHIIDIVKHQTDNETRYPYDNIRVMSIAIMFSFIYFIISVATFSA